MVTPTQSMRELMDKALIALDAEYPELKILDEYPNLYSFITDDHKSQSFIQKVLVDSNYILPNRASSQYSFSRTRARHSACTFFMGLLFTEFGGLFDSFPSIIKLSTPQPMLSHQMWKITSLYHDKAYYSEYLKKEDLDLEAQYKPYLLTDKYSDQRLADAQDFYTKYPGVFAHTYDQLLRYNDYVRAYHESWGSTNEVNDHGILGGLDTFRILAGTMSSNTTEDNWDGLALDPDTALPLIKACCLTIAQHNVFSSSRDDTDKLYDDYGLQHLRQDSAFRIGANKPLLLFLCLVDTIECLKRFSKGARKGTYLEVSTILDKTKLHVDREQIVLDYSELSEHVRSKEDPKLIADFQKYLNSLASFGKWTVLNSVVSPTNPNIITITL